MLLINGRDGTHEWNMLRSMIRSLTEAFSRLNRSLRGKFLGSLIASMALRPLESCLLDTTSPLTATKEYPTKRERSRSQAYYLCSIEGTLCHIL